MCPSYYGLIAVLANKQNRIGVRQCLTREVLPYNNNLGGHCPRVRDRGYNSYVVKNIAK